MGACQSAGPGDETGASTTKNPTASRECRGSEAGQRVLAMMTPQTLGSLPLTTPVVTTMLRVHSDEWRNGVVYVSGNYCLCSLDADPSKPFVCVFVDSDTQVWTGKNDEEGAYPHPHVVHVRDRYSELVSVCFADAGSCGCWRIALEQTIADSKLLLEYAELKEMLREGQAFEKRNHQKLGNLNLKKKKDHTRRVYVSEDFKHIHWAAPGSTEYDRIAFDDVTEVIVGAETEVFKRIGSKKFDPSLCMSVVATHRTLDLVAPDQATRDVWAKGLQAAHKFGGGYGGLEATKKLLMERTEALRRLENKTKGLQESALAYRASAKTVTATGGR